jgi:hypothetical protein
VLCALFFVSTAKRLRHEAQGCFNTGKRQREFNQPETGCVGGATTLWLVLGMINNPGLPQPWDHRVIPFQPGTGCVGGATMLWLVLEMINNPGLKQPWAPWRNRFAVEEQSTKYKKQKTFIVSYIHHQPSDVRP